MVGPFFSNDSRRKDAVSSVIARLSVVLPVSFALSPGAVGKVTRIGLLRIPKTQSSAEAEMTTLWRPAADRGSHSHHLFVIPRFDSFLDFDDWLCRNFRIAVGLGGRRT